MEWTFNSLTGSHSTYLTLQKLYFSGGFYACHNNFWYKNIIILIEFHDLFLGFWVIYLDHVFSVLL